ncbi:hypothetical protein Cob_v011106 [Colletotrichum orbiculare MAFF 240422]|uniref:Uncharacterized protein n=1 Tax=Colletotrichum orbiculare (strain 104-T / ATCC 96160 / CBS 514.97 / LARS 414 / MAFF 240422) TaxID=1213857 RepID=A0A484FGN8_COLOR|nr:hypothetical protein Cob_v011106 [Colletotrichum orbiculare MAFF 240422]
MSDSSSPTTTPDEDRTPEEHHDGLFPLREINRFKMSSTSDYNTTDLKTAAKDNAAGVYAYGQRQERPLLFAFLLAQVVFSSLPILVFSTFAISTVLFALGAAVIFALFWVGVALFILVPTLFFTCSIAILVWVWAAGIFLLAQWLYNMSPISAKGSVEVDTPNGQKLVVAKQEDGVHVRSEHE